jgi:3-Oxoacyl-[acyl-carrier-protein (ACP)] synthase III C terminal
VAKELAADPARVVHVVDRLANTSAASIPIALSVAAQAGRVHPGATVLLAAFGAGLVCGGTVVTWRLSGCAQSRGRANPPHRGAPVSRRRGSSSGARRRLGRSRGRRQSVRANRRIATAIIARPSSSTIATSTSGGTRQPNQVTPGSSARRAVSETSRWLKTRWRIGSTA